MKILSLFIVLLLFSCSQPEIKRIIRKHPNGKPEVIFYLKDKKDKSNFRKEVFFPSGKLSYRGQYKDKIKDGCWIWYFENGKKKDQCFYENGYYKGTVYHWYENGNLRQLEILPKRKVKNDDCSNCNGKIIRFNKAGRKTEELNAINDKLNGERIVYQANGDWIKGTYKNDVLNGPYYEHRHQDGKLIFVVGNYLNGLEIGKWKWFDKDSVLNETVEYKNGKCNGKFFVYYPSGKIKEKATMIDDEFDGKYFYFDENGKQTKIEVYKNGELLK
jgi:antitoxin component YwqK of YwqJK toxin-antitoxin module